LSACLPTCLPDHIQKARLRLNNTTHGHQTLPQLQIHPWDVPFQVPKFVFSLRLAPSFYRKDYGHFLLHVTKSPSDDIVSSTTLNQFKQKLAGLDLNLKNNNYFVL